MSLSTLDWLILLILSVSLAISIYYLVSLKQAVLQLPRALSVAGGMDNSVDDRPILHPFPQIAVIIPAFNETENIEDCVRSVLASSPLSETFLQVWVVDDQSTDNTLSILQTLQKQLADSRLNVLVGEPRPQQELWTGKNWACYQAAQKARGDWLLFMDADVRLKPRAIEAVVQTAIERQLDLLTCVPEIVCGSLIEWLVQPFMFINVLVSFNFKAVRDPSTTTAYALGPFLLFRQSTYRTIGGHATVASCIAEDVAFARKIKEKGFKLQPILAANLTSLRMYRTWSALWEGWTKVLYVGANYNILLMLLLAFVMLMLYSVPWLGLGLALDRLITGRAIGWVELLLSSSGILLQYNIRSIGSRALGTSTRYWWLQSLSGILIASLAIASVIKAKTGWGWTWRGRSLKEMKKRL